MGTVNFQDSLKIFRPVPQMLEEMVEKWRRGARGPLPQLTPLKLLNALMLIDREGPVGRRALAQSVQINDGIARGLLERLAEQGMVTVGETGVKLSQDGKTRLQNFLRLLSVKKVLDLGKTDLVPGSAAVGIHLAQRYRADITGLPQRDEAVKAGANGSITLAVKNGRLVVPPDDKDAADLSPRENLRLKNLFKPADNDLVIIGFASDQHRAMAGALAAVLSLSSKT